MQELVQDESHGHDRFLPLYVAVEAPQKWARPTGQGVRTWRYKYLRYEDGSEELYDLSVDPYELENRSADLAYTDVRTAMADLARRAAECRGDACRVAAPQELQG